MSLTRETILDALKSALEPLEYVHALWEGGAAAFGRVDEWSDIDLQTLCDDDRVEDVFRVTEQTLSRLSPIDLQIRLPEPLWHGHSQTFYRLEDAGPYLLIDFVVMKMSSSNRLREQEIHGDAVVHFNKNNALTEEHIDRDRLRATLQTRLERIRDTFEMFQTLTTKELHRGNLIEAVSNYHGATLRPLVEVLRMKHDPVRYNFHTRYLHYDMPDEVAERLQGLYFVTDADDLWRKHREAGEWFREVAGSLDMDSVPLD